MKKTKRAPVPRTGVNIEAETPALYRLFACCVTPYVAVRAVDKSFTVVDELRWRVALSSFNVKEVP